MPRTTGVLPVSAAQYAFWSVWPVLKPVPSCSIPTPSRASARGAERLAEDESERAGGGGRAHGQGQGARARPAPRTVEDERTRQRLGLRSPQGARQRGELAGKRVACGAAAAVRVEEDGLELRELAVERGRRGLARTVA